MTRQVDGEETINGKTYFRVRVVFTNQPFANDYTEYLRPTPEAIYRGPSPQNPSEVIDFPLPIAVGKSWTVEHGSNAQSMSTVLAMEAAVLPDKTYENCLKIHSKSPMWDGVSYYAAGIGCVKEMGTLSLPQQLPITIKSSLKAYKP